VEFALFLSLLCPWHLDGQRAGQPGLDSWQEQDFSILHNVRTSSGAHQASYPVSMGGGVLSQGVKIFANYNYFYVMRKLSSRVPTFLIESQATLGICASDLYKPRSSGKNWLSIILWYNTDCIENNMSNNYFIVASVFVAVVTFLPSHCLAKIVGYTYRHRLMGEIYEVCCWDGLRCHDIHTKFHKDWFSHSEVDRGDSQTHKQHGDIISLLLFF
jgi:hypothetical protein